MREPDGSVRMGSGSIGAWRGGWRPDRVQRAPAPADPRPLHVRMREIHALHGNWDAVADAFGYATAASARTYVLRKEREARNGRGGGAARGANTNGGSS